MLHCFMASSLAIAAHPKELQYGSTAASAFYTGAKAVFEMDTRNLAEWDPRELREISEDSETSEDREASDLSDTCADDCREEDPKKNNIAYKPGGQENCLFWCHCDLPRGGWRRNASLDTSWDESLDPHGAQNFAVHGEKCRPKKTCREAWDDECEEANLKKNTMAHKRLPCEPGKDCKNKCCMQKKGEPNPSSPTLSTTASTSVTTGTTVTSYTTSTKAPTTSSPSSTKKPPHQYNVSQYGYCAVSDENQGGQFEYECLSGAKKTLREGSWYQCTQNGKSGKEPRACTTAYPYVCEYTDEKREQATICRQSVMHCKWLREGKVKLCDNKLDEWEVPEGF